MSNLPAADAAANATASEPGGDCVLAIVDDLNRQLARWLDQHHTIHARTCGAATELAFDADVSGLDKADRARLRRLLVAQGFSVAPGIMTYADSSAGEQELFAIYRAIPGATVAALDANRGDEGEQQEQDTDCCFCEASVAPDFVKFPTCEHVMCYDCYSREEQSHDNRSDFGCFRCDERFSIHDVRHLDDSAYNDAQPPPSKRQRTDATTASE